MDNAQELLQRLNHSGKRLSKSHRRIAECIVTHYDKAAFMTASKLGEYVGVSESTLFVSPPRSATTASPSCRRRCRS